MRKTLSVIAIVLLAFPAIGQDDFGGGGFGGFEGVLTGGDIDALLGGGRGNRGNNNNNPLANPEGLFLQLRDLLKAQKVPLSKDQEKTLRTFIDTESLAMRTDLETQMGNRGNRGNNNVNTMTLLQDIFTIVSKNNTDLLTAMKADLTSDQVSLITKAEKDKKVCSVMMDMFNPNALQNRNNNNNNNRGNNNQNQNFNNLPFGIEGLDFGGGGNPQGNRGNNNNNWMQQFPDRTFCTTAASTPAERLVPISQILSKGKKPLTAEQEKKFVGLIEVKVPAMQAEIKEKEPRMLSLINDINNQGNNQNRGNNNTNNNNPPAVNPQTLRNNIVNTVLTQLGVQNNNNNNNNNRGGRGNFNQNQNQNNQNQNTNQANANNNAAAENAAASNANANNAAANNNQNRGGNRGNNFNNNFNPQAEIQKKTEELYDKVAAKLNPDQGVVVKKLKYDQIKAKGGVERYRGIMEQEGTPLTPEQTTQIQNLFNTQYTALRQFAEQTVQAEMDKQPTLEPPPPAPAQNQNQNQNQNRPNPNNVAQNPIAQQIIAKVMPLVSQRRAILEKSVTDTIMKVLTPAQIASYKLSSM